MPKQTSSASRTATPAKASGKKRSRAVGPGAASSPSVEPVAARPHEPSHDEIAERAYTLYAARGFRDGDAVWDWVSAQQQLRSA